MEYDLVFEGGGAKGMVFSGALKAFEERGHTFGRLMGTSAGAIAATFLAAGYSADEMQDALSERVNGEPVFAGFLGVPESFDTDIISASATREWLKKTDIPIIPDGWEDRVDEWIVETLLKSALYRHIFSFVERGGWYSADAFLAWLKRKLDEGTVNGEPRRYSDKTLKEFFEETKVDLTLLAADVTDGRLLVLNHRTAPDLPLVWAVRMSMSVPLLWQEVIWQPEWGAYRGKDIGGNAVVDGGLLSNFPIELFITEEPMWTAVMGPKKSDHLIGMLIDERLPVPGVDPDDCPAASSLADLRTVGRIKGLVETVTQARDKAVISAYKDFVLRLPAKCYQTTEFNMEEWKRELLVKAGEEKMTAFLNEQGSTPPTTSPVFEAVGFFNQADDVAAKLLGE
ncbi:MAG: patatin-like phospholipase family protein [Candidatus Promineifilaceae bacterium]